MNAPRVWRAALRFDGDGRAWFAGRRATWRETMHWLHCATVEDA